ncbi:MAG: CheY-like chemotaxis protein, partial [Arcticibacterium sp.]
MSQIIQQNLSTKAKVKPSILLVIGNEELRDDILELLGVSYSLRVAKNITIAKEELTENGPDLVVIDDSLLMNEVLKLSTWIKNDVWLDHIPIVALSTDTSEEAHLDAVSAQIDVFLATDTHNLMLLYLVLKNLLESILKQRLWYSQNYLKESRQLTSGRKDESFLV